MNTVAFSFPIALRSIHHYNIISVYWVNSMYGSVGLADSQAAGRAGPHARGL